MDLGLVVKLCIPMEQSCIKCVEFGKMDVGRTVQRLEIILLDVLLVCMFWFLLKSVAIIKSEFQSAPRTKSIVLTV